MNFGSPVDIRVTGLAIGLQLEAGAYAGEVADRCRRRARESRSAIGARHYVALRAQWDGTVGQLASALGHTREQIDPAGTHPERTMKGPRPTTELAREPFPEGPGT
jgi:hypothetical protein